ncbi:MAG TPA: TrmH family RNA methyltransferase [Polyangiaceae bacterium]
MAKVFLYSPQDFHNVCLLARTLEVFGLRECFVFDPNGLIRERYGKVRTRELRAVSAGAFEQIAWTRISEPEDFLRAQSGRVVATVASPAAVSLERFAFAATDLLLFGSESRGLPEAVVAASTAAVTIASRGKTQSLNLAVAVGIVLFEWQRQVARE